MPGRIQERDRVRRHGTLLTQSKPSMQPVQSPMRTPELMDLLRSGQWTKLSSDILQHDKRSPKRQRVECDRHRILRHTIILPSHQLDA